MDIKFVAKTVGRDKYAELDSEEIVAAIARHGIIKEDNGRLIRYLMTHNHWSPLDMINLVFEIETSRAIGRQILRHASIKFQEHSQRYSDRVQFEEIELRKEHPTNRQSSTEVFEPLVKDNGVVRLSQLYKEYLDYTQWLYNKSIELGVAKECARMILPECTTTTISANGTLRSWLSFLNVRCHEDTQKELVIIANLIGEELEKELPNVFKTIDWRSGLFM